MSFAAACYGAYNGAVRPYHTSSNHLPQASEQGPCSSANSIRIGVAGLKLGDRPQVAQAIATMYDETSGPNKRPRPSSKPPGPSEQSRAREVDHQPPRPKRKSQKKRTEPTPLLGMFNDTIGSYDKAISVRQMLQGNKIDISWMDLVAWSPQVCKELKRICTRVTKKREKKGSLPKAPAIHEFDPRVYNPLSTMPAAPPPMQPAMPP